MSNDFSNIPTGDVKITPKKIRSKHRLRMMIRLSEEAETVSDLAQLVGLRVPHASAEIRKMREEGLVSSDLITGSRGAKISLSERGWHSLNSDEWFKALLSLPIPRELEKYSILYHEGDDILFGFLEKPKNPLALVPDRLPDSSGNEGVSWNWATLNESSLKWFNLDTMERITEQPEKPNPLSIESYLEKPQVIGIMRGKILNKNGAITASTSKWFNPPKEKPRPPLTENIYHRGSWTLGECHDMMPLIKPKEAIIGIINDSLYKSMLLRTAKKNALLIGDLRGLDSGETTYPLGALKYWIEIVHPRITNQERKKRLTALQDKIIKNKRIRVSDSTWRKFRNDWGVSIFSEKSYSRNIDTRGLKKSSVESLIIWAIKDKDKSPLVLDLNDKISENTLSLVESYSNLRLLILKKQITQFENYDKLDTNSHRPLPWFNFHTKEGKIPLKLIESQYQENSFEESLQTTISPWDIMSIEANSDFVPELLDDEYYSIVKSSISQYPLGDEEWSNQIEARYPLASWIASPPRGRWPRWQRLRGRLDPEWLALLDLNYLPIERLVEVANEAPPPVLGKFSESMGIKLRDDPDIFLRSRPAIDSNSASIGVSWIAAQFLSNAAWMPENMHNDMREWAIDAWIRPPPLDSLPAIKGIHWLYTKKIKDVTEVDTMMLKLKNKNKTMPPDNQFQIWSNMLDMILNNKKLNREELGFVLKEMPSDWWAIEAQNLLRNALRDDKMKWVLKLEIPWCSTILRPEGENIDAPGISSKVHPGWDYSILTDLKREKNSLESDSINDFYEALDCSLRNLTPKKGRTHELSGWLAQPVEKWPNFSITEATKGNTEIMARIFLRCSGFPMKEKLKKIIIK